MKNSVWSVTPAPFVFSGFSLHTTGIAVFLTFVPQLVLLACLRDFAALTVIFSALAGAVLAELCFFLPVFGGGQKSFDFSVLLCGLITGFLLPTATHPVLAVCASFFGLFVARNFFNGTGNAWLNASVLSVFIVCLSSPLYFPERMAVQYTAPSATAFPSVTMRLNPAPFDVDITNMLNTFVLQPLGIHLPEGYVSLFFQPDAPVAAFKFNIVTLAASLVFFVMDIADRIVPVVFLAVYAAAVFFFPDFFRASLFAPGGSGDVLFAIFSGGLFFTAFYLLSDVATLPRTKPGRVILGVFAGAAAFFTCGLGGDTLLGAVCTVFLANMLSPAIEYIENRLLKAAPVETVLYDR